MRENRKYPVQITRVAIEYNVSTETLIRFFKKKFNLDLTERSKLSQSQFEIVEKEFAQSRMINEQESKPKTAKGTKPKNIKEGHSRSVLNKSTDTAATQKIRIVKVAKQVNHSIEDLVNILEKNGIIIESKPTFLITEKMRMMFYKELNLEDTPLPKLTKRALRKIKKKKVKEQQEIQENHNRKWKSLFGILKTKNPKGHSGFGPGGLWPVKK